MRLWICLLSIVACADVASAGQAQTTRPNCQNLRGSLATLTPQMQRVLDDTERFMPEKLTGTFGGAEQESLKRLSERRDALKPVLRAYVEEMEDLNYLITKCAR